MIHKASERSFTHLKPGDVVLTSCCSPDDNLVVATVRRDGSNAVRVTFVGRDGSVLLGGSCVGRWDDSPIGANNEYGEVAP